MLLRCFKTASKIIPVLFCFYFHLWYLFFVSWMLSNFDVYNWLCPKTRAWHFLILFYFCSLKQFIKLLFTPPTRDLVVTSNENYWINILLNIFEIFKYINKILTSSNSEFCNGYHSAMVTNHDVVTTYVFDNFNWRHLVFVCKDLITPYLWICIRNGPIP